MRGYQDAQDGQIFLLIILQALLSGGGPRPSGIELDRSTAGDWVAQSAGG